MNPPLFQSAYTNPQDHSQGPISAHATALASQSGCHVAGSARPPGGARRPQRNASAHPLRFSLTLTLRPPLPSPLCAPFPAVTLPHVSRLRLASRVPKRRSHRPGPRRTLSEPSPWPWAERRPRRASILPPGSTTISERPWSCPCISS